MYLSGHIISFEWREFEPVLTLYDGELHEIGMTGWERMEMDVGKELICVGTLSEDGYSPCPDSAVITGAWRQCPSCAKPFIPDLSCVFEPKCDGSICGAEFCSRPHIVYLAITGKLLKIGMTSEKRQRQRLIEQGADAYGVIYHAENRLDARRMERVVSDSSGIKQAHPKKDVLSEMRRKPDYESMKVRFSRLLPDVMDSSGIPPEFHILDGYPIDLPLRRVPFLRPAAGRHMGKVLGIKGRFMIYDAPGIYAVDMSDMVGRRVKMSVKFK